MATFIACFNRCVDLFTVSTITNHFKEIRMEEVSRSTDKKKPHVIMEK